jgi:3-hydroxyisobutyrate dehydrogenase-like beta-hydroxyacid dehydrogenase
VTSDLLAADGVDEAVDGRILVECSVGDPENRIALDAWATERGAQYMTGIIKAHPREVGTREALFNFWGSQEAYSAAEPTLAALGRVEFLGTDIREQETLLLANVALAGVMCGAFCEVVAYVLASQVDLTGLPERIATAHRFAMTFGERAVRRLTAGAGADEVEVEAPIDAWEAALAPLVESIQASGIDPRITRASLERFREGQAAGLGARDSDMLIDFLAGQLPTPAETG